MDEYISILQAEIANTTTTTNTSFSDSRKHGFTTLDDENLKRHLLEMADMVISDDKRLMDDYHKLNYLRNSVAKIINVLKAAHGSWEDVIFYTRKESAYYLITNDIPEGKYLKTLNIIERRSKLAYALLKERRTISGYLAYFVMLDRNIKHIMQKISPVI